MQRVPVGGFRLVYLPQQRFLKCASPRMHKICATNGFICCKQMSAHNTRSFKPCWCLTWYSYCSDLSSMLNEVVTLLPLYRSGLAVVSVNVTGFVTNIYVVSLHHCRRTMLLIEFCQLCWVLSVPRILKETKRWKTFYCRKCSTLGFYDTYHNNFLQQHD